MKYTDEEQANNTIETAEAADNANKSDSAVEDVKVIGTADGFSDIIETAIKTVAVVLSFVLLVTCILAVALPLSSMRIFNSLGMSERAVDFAERYISTRLDEYGANSTDELGNYDVLMRTNELSDAEFIEAIYVCNSLSYRLMENNYRKGNDGVGAYYAERLEKYTRMYLSLNDVARINAEISERNMTSMPSAMLRPVVYSYGNEMRALNFRARARLAKTEYAAYNSRSNDAGCMIALSTLSNTFSGRVAETPGQTAALLDDFCDYLDQLGEYLDVEFLRAGVENDPFARVELPGLGNVLIATETAVGQLYSNVLDGSEFGLFINKLDGYTNIFTQLAGINTATRLPNISNYVQAAVDFVPGSGGGDARDEQLRQLFWLQNMNANTQKLWYLELLLYHNKELFGRAAAEINDKYGTCQRFMNVVYGGQNVQISNVYSEKLAEYMKIYN